MNEDKLKRINELARKSKAEGLTEAERAEQADLRREYIEAVRMNLRGQLNNIDIRENDGSITNLGENMEKKAIREQIFAARKKMSESERLHNSSLICKRIMEDETFAMAACVYAYMDCKGEVGMEPLLRACWETGKPIAVPKVFERNCVSFISIPMKTLHQVIFTYRNL